MGKLRLREMEPFLVGNAAHMLSHIWFQSPHVLKPDPESSPAKYVLKMRTTILKQAY